MLFQDLPVELIADILGELDLENLVKMCYLSKRFYMVASDSSLNPWRKPIARNLNAFAYEKVLKHLSVRSVVPRHNWIEILTSARPSYILYEATLPNMKSSEWEECFSRRFLPSWKKWKKESSWKEAYLKMLHRVWHRTMTSCKADESWTKYVILNRNGAVNEMEASTRNFNPSAVFDEYKLQSNLSHLETRIRLVLQLSDVRILTFGTLSRSFSSHILNPNAHIFFNPPGIVPYDQDNNPLRRITSAQRPYNLVDDHRGFSTLHTTSPALHPSKLYTRLQYPQPSPTHYNYPFFTPDENGTRWIGSEEFHEDGLHWVGSLMIIAQLLGPSRDPQNAGGHQYASFDWGDLLAISPWMEDFITKKIDGPGLGH
ncbi:hypothetical protein BDN70DRAFT_802580 [Pholiota conissans]|uniref:F-box domain-containing protein n=1 Tax=Pholiota conissans TaxID=109636 RepID=A0A9P6CWG6_9AGAR|nr:hypothetical protein BDN70DRAFT_802580 [Pholiota conissans]